MIQHSTHTLLNYFNTIKITDGNKTHTHTHIQLTETYKKVMPFTSVNMQATPNLSSTYQEPLFLCIFILYDTSTRNHCFVNVEVFQGMIA